MKRGLTTLFLFAVALGLGAYIYFVESKRAPASEQAEQKAKVFDNLDTTKIDEVTVTAGGTDTQLRKQSDKWTITAPLAADADANELQGIATNLGSVEIQRVVDEKPSDLAQFGLNPPKTSVTFKAAGESAPRTLLLGEKTATGGDLYAKVASDPKVFLVPGYVENTFNRTTFDLRDKAVMKLERDQITGLEFVTPERTVAFAREGSDSWKMTAPSAARADFGSVDGFVSRVLTAQMKSLVAESATDLKQYGLDKPTRQANFLMGSARSSLILGGKSPDGLLYAKDLARPQIFTLEANIADDISRPVDEFRPKDVFDFRSFTGNRFEVTRAGTTLAFEREVAKDPSGRDTWVQVQPKPAAPVESSKIEDFLARVANLRAQTYVPALPPGATEGARTVARSNDGKKVETVTFYRQGADAFAVREMEPGAAKFPGSEYDDAVKVLEGFK